MRQRQQVSNALTIAGSDSGGGAGIQADLKTFAALGVHGTSAITCVTAQNPRSVRGVEPCSPKMIRLQLEAVFAELRPTAVKTGMLYSKEIIRTVVKFLDSVKSPPLVVDPVMIATSGARLLDPAALDVLKTELLPRAAVVTPNLAEAEILAGGNLRSVEEMRAAAREIYRSYGCAVLVKGGHLRGYREAVDFFYDGRSEWMLKAPFIKGVHPHGSGCTYSAAITAHLARGVRLPAAVARGKQYISRAIARGVLAGRHFILASSPG